MCNNKDKWELIELIYVVKEIVCTIRFENKITLINSLLLHNNYLSTGFLYFLFGFYFIRSMIASISISILRFIFKKIKPLNISSSILNLKS